MSVTAQLSEEIVATLFEDVPEQATQRMKRLMIDSVGVAFVGYEATGSQLSAYATEVLGNEEATIIGDGRRVPCGLAAGINAQIARDTDFEETGPGLHAGPSIVHTALAVGQRVRASGREVLAAACLGYEINGRFHHARRDPNVLRHHTTCVTIVTAKLLGLDADAVNRAIGLSWDFPTSPLLLTRAPIVKRVSRLGIGNLWVCRNGVQAGLMALNGYEGLADELDQQSEDYDLTILAHSRTPFAYTASEIEMKPFPASRGCQGALLLCRRIVEREGIAAEDIDRIIVRLPNIYLIPHQYNPDPTSYWEAIYSTQWGVTMSALGIEPGPEWFTDERLRDKSARTLLGKVEIIEDPESTRARNEKRRADMANTIQIHVGSQVFSERILMRDVWGNSATPMPDDVFTGKFLSLAGRSLGPPGARELLGLLDKIEDVADVNDIAPHLAHHDR